MSAPPAMITARAVTVTVRLLAARATMPLALPPSKRIFSIVAPVNNSAPALSAIGMYETFIERLASVGQPNTHTPLPSQSGALRRNGP